MPAGVASRIWESASATNADGVVVAAAVGVFVTIGVSVGTGVLVAVTFGSGVGVSVGTSVADGVLDGVAVLEGVGVLDGVAVFDGVAVGPLTKVSTSSGLVADSRDRIVVPSVDSVASTKLYVPLPVTTPETSSSIQVLSPTSAVSARTPLVRAARFDQLMPVSVQPSPTL